MSVRALRQAQLLSWADSEFNFYRPTRLCQTQYDSEDQERKIHALSRVDDDAIQVLRKRQVGNAYRKTPLMTDPGIPQGW